MNVSRILTFLLSLAISIEVAAQGPGLKAGTVAVQKQWHFFVTVGAVNPAGPVLEHTAITVDYQVVAKIIGVAGAAPSTRISICPADRRGGCRVVNEVVETTYTGKLQMLAPPAGAGAPIGVAVFEVPPRPIGAEFDVEIRRALGVAPMQVAARYDIVVDQYHASTTRAPRNDTIEIYLNAALLNQIYTQDVLCQVPESTYCVGPVKQGTHGEGSYNVTGVRVGTFELVPDIGPDVGFAYAVLNHGESELQGQFEAFMNTMTMAVAGGFSAYFGAQGGSGGGGGWDTLEKFANKMHAMGRCDGPVAIEAVLLPNKKNAQYVSLPTLDSLTIGNGTYSLTSKQFEYKSQDGCGRSPRYRVSWSVRRLSWQPWTPF